MRPLLSIFMLAAVLLQGCKHRETLEDLCPVEKPMVSVAAMANLAADIKPVLPASVSAPIPAPAYEAARLDEESYSFVVLGDTQFHNNDCHAGPTELNALPGAVLQLKPDFMLHVGDLMHEARDPNTYHIFSSCLSDMLDRIPLFPAVGNHDMDYDLGIANFREYLQHQLFVRNASLRGSSYSADFPMTYLDDPAIYSQDKKEPREFDLVPSGFAHKLYYAFRHRNAYFVIFEVGTRWEVCTPPKWVEHHLRLARSDTSIDHLFVVLHHPLYSTFMDEGGGGDNLTSVRGPYEALFRKYDVTTVFTGHAHVYERFYVPDDGTPTRSKNRPRQCYNLDGEGVHHLTVGPSGSAYMPGDYCANVPEPREEPSLAYLQGRGCGHNVAQVQVRGKQVDVNIVGITGSPEAFQTSLWDSFTIREKR